MLVLLKQLEIPEVGAQNRLSNVKKARRRARLEVSGLRTRGFNPEPILILKEKEDLTAVGERKLKADLVANII